METQLLLPLSGDVTDRCRLQASSNSALAGEKRKLTGKRLQAFSQICNAGKRGLTMREMANLTDRGINCWTQPFLDLRVLKLIRTTDERRVGGVVHVATGNIYEGGD